MFEYDTLVGSSRVGPDRRLSLGAAVDYIQDCEWFDIMGEPVAAAYFKEMGVGMVVIFRQLELIRMPLLAEELRVKTWAYDCTRLLGFRNTMICDRQGRICVAGNSIGAFVSTESGKVDRVEQRVADSIEKAQRYPMEYLPRRIHIPQSSPVMGEAVRVCWHHLDSNRHMNNARYLEIAEDSLGDRLSYSRIRVEYKIPAQLGNVLTPRIYGQDCDRSRIVRLLDLQGRENAVVEFSEG